MVLCAAVAAGPSDYALTIRQILLDSRVCLMRPQGITQNLYPSTSANIIFNTSVTKFAPKPSGRHQFLTPSLGHNNNPLVRCVVASTARSALLLSLERTLVPEWAHGIGEASSKQCAGHIEELCNTQHFR